MLFALLFSGNALFSQAIRQQALVMGLTDDIYSEELSEVRTLNIYLPEGYNADSAARYPVIYVLDGSIDEDFPHIMGLVQFLSFPWITIVSPSIVVGIANVNRKRDFTSPSSDSTDIVRAPGNGGSEKFIRFVENELQPYITNNYNTTDQKTVIGQSLGGLLATEILVRKPELFTHYVIISPSLWWNHSTLLADIPAFLKSHSDLKKDVFIAVGNEGKEMNDDVKQMAGYFKKYAPKTVNWKYLYLPEENHATALHRGAYAAFEFFAEGKLKTQ